MLIFIGFIIYANILNAPFQLDDHGLMLRNPLLKNIPFLIKNWEVPGRKFLTFFTFALNYHFGKENPFGYHVVNIILHIATGCMFYCLLRNIFSIPEFASSNISKQKNLFSLFASVIFICHPLQTQAVTYIWQRSEVLSGLFYILSFYFYLKGRLRKRISFLLGSFFIFFIGLFAKGTVITVPIMILLTECIFFNTERIKKIFIKTWPFVTLAFTLLAYFWETFTLVTTSILKKIGLPFFAVSRSSVSDTHLITQSRVIMGYLRLVFLPINQNIDYFILPSGSIFEVKVIMSFFILISILVVAFRISRKHKLASFSIFWFFIYLIPTSVIGLRDAMWEHRLYISIAGFSMFFVYLIFNFVKNVKIRNMALVFVIGVLCALTIARNILWCSPELLLKDTIKKNPMSYRSLHLLGTLYHEQGRTQEAIEAFRRVLKINPRYPETYNNLGVIYMNNGYLTTAVKYFQKALTIRENFLIPYLNLADIAYYWGQFRQAQYFLERSLQIQETEKAYADLGNVHVMLGEFKKAKYYFQKALAINPNNKIALFGLDKMPSKIRNPD